MFNKIAENVDEDSWECSTRFRGIFKKVLFILQIIIFLVDIVWENLEMDAKQKKNGCNNKKKLSSEFEISLHLNKQ